MTRWGAIAMGLFLLLAAGACGASADSGASPALASGVACGPGTARTIRADSAARIYSVGHKVYGCSRQTGRRTLLGSDFVCVGTDRVGPFALAGPVAAYGSERCGVDTGSSEVQERRLTDGRVLTTQAAHVGSIGVEAYDTVESIVVKADGALAWIDSGRSIVGHRAPSVEVLAVPVSAKAEKLLDSGAGIQTGSLRLRGSTLSWRNGNSRRTARLR